MPYALVAGGSKGIGFTISEALAKRKYNLILIGRNEDSLLQAKRELASKYKVEIEIIIKDLSNSGSADEIADWCINKKLPITFLCNVAGIGGAQDYLQSPLPNMRSMVRLNIESLMALTMQLLPVLRLNS